jgi:uncharacterized protein
MRRACGLLTVLAALTSCSHGAAAKTVTIRSSGGEVQVRAEVADDDAERERGLSGRTALGADDGMVFLFDAPVDARFWMKDTTIPLSIAFWGRDGAILEIDDMAPCRADPCPTFGPGRPFVGALEVNRGFFAEHAVAEGDHVALG